jgi:hypothetical protein
MAVSFPVGKLLAHGQLLREALVEAWLGHHRELNVGHVEPAPLFGRIAYSQFTEDSTGLCGCKGFV